MTACRRTLSAAAAFFCFSTVFAAPDFSGITAREYPDADSLTVEEIRKASYNPDGTGETVTEAWVKILTEKGRRQESVLTIGYSRRYGEVEILYVGAIGVDGKEREIDVSSTTKESTDNGSMDSNIYDPLDRKIVCTIPGLAVGETLHLKFSRKTLKSRVKDHWADICVMEWKSPILKSVYEVKAPASRPIRSKAVRNPLGNVVETSRLLEDGSTLHVFTATNSPQMFPEPDMPPVYTQVQNVRLSTARSWREISKWYWDLCLPHLEKTNYAMEEKVKELKGDLSGEALVRSVFKFVSQEIRYMGLTMEDTSPGYAPHDVDITFDSRYGVCRDKAGLLVAMLRLAGVEAFPVLINVGAKMDAEVPSPFFNHAVVAVQLDPSKREYIFMDPTNENTKDLFPAYLGDRSCLVCREDGEELMISPVSSSASNAVDIVSTGKLSKDGSLVVESSVSFLGINDTAYRGTFARMTPDERERAFERIAGRLAAGAELVSADISPKDMHDTEKPLKADIIYRVPEAVLKGETRSELVVPFVSKTLGIVNWLLEGSTSLEERRFPLVLDTTAEVNETVKIDLADVLGEARALPPAEKTAGGYEYSREFSVKDGQLLARRRLAVSKVEFSPGEYAALREEIKRVEATERRKPVFAADDLADADTEILLDSSVTVISSAPEDAARSWTTTNEVVKRVLTYAGKKESAELKFAYNPAWKKIEILEASVSNENGVVSRVSPKEMNVMDAPWTAAAPRYPAGKILVVNLPSVEVGSVISVKTAVTVKNAPMPFYAVYFFDSKNPMRRKSVRVDGWRREAVNPRRVADEPNQPDARLWRDVVTVSKCDWDIAAEILSQAAEIPETQCAVEGLEGAEIEEIRNWMARNVKVAGPSLYEVALSSQVTDPATVIKERYATRLDYVRTLAALLDRAGYDVDIVFAANDALKVGRLRKMDIGEHPAPRVFSDALCRVKVREGGFFGIGGETKTFYIGIENEYTPLGTTPYDGCTFFDPVERSFGEAAVSEDKFRALKKEESVWDIRANGGIDLETVFLTYGSGVGDFRKNFSEILPEERGRLYRSLLGMLSQGASATGELVTDVTAYPSKTSFKCFIPDFATVEDGAVSLTLHPFECPLPELSGNVRETPIATGSRQANIEVFTLRFPEGYTRIDHLPEDIFDETSGTRTVSSRVEDDRLVVTITQRVDRAAAGCFAREYFPWLKDVRRRFTSRANRTIVVRRATGKQRAGQGE